MLASEASRSMGSDESSSDLDKSSSGPDEAAEEARAAFIALHETQQRAMCVLADHTLFVEHYGHRSPQAIAARETYAAARLDAACFGIELPRHITQLPVRCYARCTRE